jgi:hypothetical protein
MGCRLTLNGDYVELSGNITQCELANDMVWLGDVSKMREKRYIE